MSDDPQSQSDPWIGATVAGRYHVVRRIGVGGHGAVYEVEHAWTRRRVAMKMLRSDRTHVAGIVERFLREAQAATQVKHPNIVDVFDMGQDGDDGALYIVEELLLGDDLRQVLKTRRALPLSEALTILTPVMSALEAAHRAGVVHRDVKPGNIFLSRVADGVIVPKLIDFGTSRVAEDPSDTSHLTMTGEPVGTPAYMSPEQVRGVRAGAEVDVWAMGVVLYETLSGARPFVAPNYGALVLRIATEDPQRLESVAPEVPRAVADVIHRALARRVADRYASMGDFLAELQRAAMSATLTPLDFDTGEDRTIETQLPVADVLAVSPLATVRTPRSSGHHRTTIDPPRVFEAPQPTFESSPPGVASTPVQWSASEVPEPPPPTRRRVIVAAIASSVLVALALVVTASRTHPTQPAARPPVAQPAPQPVAAPVAPPPPQPVAAPVAPPPPQPVAAPVAPPVAEPVAQPTEEPSVRSRVRPAPPVRDNLRVRPRTNVTNTHPATVDASPQRVAPRGEYEIP